MRLSPFTVGTRMRVYLLLGINMTRLHNILFFALVLGLARADDTSASLAPKGVIILNAVAGHDAAAVSFSSIEWTNSFGGVVVDGVGAKTGFTNEAIGKIIYFDQVFYDQLDKNPAWIDWRAGLQSREFVVRQNAPGVLTRGDLPALQADEAALEDASQRYPLAAPLLAPQETLLKDEVGKLSSGLVCQNGKWMSQQEADATSAVPVVGDAANTVTFTSKDGRKFANAKATVTDTGLSLLTSDGGGSVAFDQLPDDLSVFPKKLQDQIAAGKHALAAAASAATSAPAPETPPAPKQAGAGTAQTSAAATDGSTPVDHANVIVNGDFSQVDANGFPVGWKVTNHEDVGAPPEMPPGKTQPVNIPIVRLLGDTHGDLRILTDEPTGQFFPGESFQVMREGNRTFLHVALDKVMEHTQTAMLYQEFFVPSSVQSVDFKMDVRCECAVLGNVGVNSFYELLALGPDIRSMSGFPIRSRSSSLPTWTILPPRGGQIGRNSLIGVYRGGGKWRIKLNLTPEATGYIDYSNLRLSFVYKQEAAAQSEEPPAEKPSRFKQIPPGMKLIFEGSAVFFMDASGHRKRVPDGQYIMPGNGIMTVRGGQKAVLN
jgi:hypothetical protein